MVYVMKHFWDSQLTVMKHLIYSSSRRRPGSSVLILVNSCVCKNDKKSIYQRFMRKWFAVGMIGTLLSISQPAGSAPQGGEITRGSGNIQTPDTQTTLVKQQSQNLSINWQSLDLAADELLRFQQPNAQATALNHILDQRPSEILGRIEANGRVFLMNPNGILFGESARINVSALVAGSAWFESLNDKDEYRFTTGPGLVDNAGTITTPDGGSVTLLGQTVRNRGQINARLGRIHLLSAGEATLSFDADGLLQFSLQGEVLDNAQQVSSAVQNSGQLQADGGNVVLEAHAAHAVFKNVINNEGIIQASRINNQGGVIRLEGWGGNVIHSGIINATGVNGGHGGDVSLRGDRIGILDNARVNASGDSGGGRITIGGNRKGTGEHTAQFTQFGRDANLRADATVSGTGGEIVLWADDTTWALGSVSATGGVVSGDGGFVEISGKQGLVLGGNIDTSATNGQYGTLLLDPTDITIHDQADGAQPNDGLLPDLSDTTQGVGTFDIGELALEGLANNSNLVLEATNNIIVNDLADNVLAFAIDSSGSISMAADTDSDGAGSFSMNSSDTISTQGGGLSISGAGVSLGSLNTDGPVADGAITINSTASAVMGASTAGTANINVAVDTDADGAESLTLTGSLSGGSVALQGGSNGGDTLVGPNLPNAWTVTALNTGTLNGASFSNFPNLTGGSDDDTFSVSGIGSIGGIFDGGADTTGDTVDYSAATGLISVTLNTDVTNIESLVGGGADYSLLAEDIANTWIITAQNDGSVAGVAFTDFSNLTGGTGDDDFILSGGSITGTINGGAGTDSITANNTANIWNITAADSGTVDGVPTFSNIENLFGGSGTDSFILNSGSISGAIDGGAGSDSLAPDDVPNTWTISANDAGTVTGVGSFANIENLNGRNDTDDFSIADGVSVSGTIDGGGGTDSLDLSLQTGLVVVDLSAGNLVNIENYTGNGANSTLIGDNVVNVWTIDGSSDGIDDGSVGTVSFIDFANLTGGADVDSFTLSSGTLSGILNGGAGSDTLIADNMANTWSITGADSGLATGVGSFASIENLTGNAGTDDFSFGVSGSLSGVVDGSTNTDTVDYSAVAGALTVTIGASGFSNIEILVGNNDTNSTLVGANTINDWTFTGINAGTVNSTDFSAFNNITGGSNDDTFTLSGGSIGGVVDGGLGNDILVGDSGANVWNIIGANSGDVNGVGSFNNVENLTGNASSDDFIFAGGGSLTGIINGAAGADSVDFSAKVGAVIVDLSNTNFLSIETFVGNNVDSTLIATNTANTWSITGVNDGTVGVTNFVDFTNLQGNNGSDDFVLSSGGSISGSISGGAGSDSIQGYATGAAWTISGVDVGNLTGVGAFNGIETLLGNNGVDSFTFSNGSSFSGIINGGAGSDSVDFSAELGAVSVDLSTSAFLNIESFTGNDSNSSLTGDITSNSWTITGPNSGTINGITFAGFTDLLGNSQTDQFFVTGGSISGSIDGGAGSDSLTGDNTVNTWTILGADQGSVTGISSFTQIENITGNSLQDAFVFANGATISGIVDGAGGTTDSVDFSAETGSVNISLGVSAYTNIESFIGNNTDSTLVGPVSATNTWDITGNNDGTVNGIAFTNFNNLTGNISTDIFQFQNGTTITGLIDGGAGQDTVDLSLETGVVSVSLGAAGFVNIEDFIGNNLTSTLTGDNVANTWIITGNNTGTVGTVDFSGFNNLVGNNNTDDFSLNGGSISGTIDGGAGSDSITADGVSNTWTISSADAGAVTGISSFNNIENLVGGSAADNFVFADGSSISGSVDGGAGSDAVDQSAQSGIVNIILGGSGFSNVENFTGNGTNSTLVGDNIVNTWSINGLDAGTVGAVSFNNFSNLQGGTNNDTFVVNSGSLNGQIDGGAGSDLLQANNIANLWNITGADVGNVTGVGSFSGIETLSGNASTDNFVFADGSSFSGLIDGGAGVDTVDYSSETGAVLASLATGQYLNIENFVGNNTNSTLVGDNIINTWLVNGANAGNVNGINFSGFNNLSGNASSDIFTLNAGSISGSIDGGTGNDTLQADNIVNTWNVTSPDAGNVTNVNAFQNIDNLLGGTTGDTFNIGANISGNVDAGGGDDVFFVSALITVGGSLNGNSGTDSLTGPTQNSNWMISGMDSGDLNGIAFDQVETLLGNTGADTFVVSNGASSAISGGISGGAGNDDLQVDYIAASTRTIVFDGGSGTDSITLTGSGTGLSNSYVFGPASDQVSITTSETSNTQVINGTTVESVADSLSADNIALVGSSGDDVMTLGPGSIGGVQPVSFQISGLPSLQFSNKTNLSLDAGLGTDSVTINGTVQIAGNMDISTESILEGTGGVLSADTLSLNQATTIGLSGAALSTAVNTLLINGPTVDAYINEADGLALAVNNLSGVLDVTTGAGDITSAGNFNVSGTSSFTVGNAGSIILDNAANQFAGTPSFAASSGSINNLTLVDNSAVDLPALTLSGNLSVTSGGPLSQAGALQVQGTSNLDSGANSMTLDNAANDFVGDVTLQNSGAASTTLSDVNGLVLAASSVGAGTLSVSAADISQSGAIVQAASAGAANFTATGGNIDLTNGANDFTGTVYLNNTSSGNVSLVESNGLSLGSSTTNGGDLTVTAGNGITLSGTTTSSGGDITVTANSGDIQLGRLDSGAGRLTINAVTGKVIGNNSTILDPNLSSQTLEILAGDTIGDFNNPISVNVYPGGTSYFVAGNGSANIIGITGTVLSGSVIVNNVAATNNAVGKGQSVSFLEQSTTPPLQSTQLSPLFTVSSGGLHLPEYPRTILPIAPEQDPDEKRYDD